MTQPRELSTALDWLDLIVAETHGIATGAPEEEHIVEYQAMARNAGEAARKAIRELRTYLTVNGL